MNKRLALQSTLHTVLISLALASTSSAVFANSNASHSAHNADASISREGLSIGTQGNPKKVNRTIAVDMSDMMRFTPGEITVKQGETIRFVVSNKGKALHEMVLGTMAELKSHNEMMRRHPGMEHDEAYMTHVAPGKKGEIVWQFTAPGEFYYACLIPGHFEAGMFGKIKVAKG